MVTPGEIAANTPWEESEKDLWKKVNFGLRSQKRGGIFEVVREEGILGKESSL